MGVLKIGWVSKIVLFNGKARIAERTIFQYKVSNG